MLDDLDDDRQDAHDDNENENDLDVFLHELDIAEEVAGERDEPGPQHGTDGTEGEEATEVHAADAGDGRDKRAHDRHEPSEDDRACAVLLEEGMRFVDVFALEEPGVRLSKHCGAHLVANPIAHDVAEDRDGDKQRDRSPDIEGDEPLGNEHPGDEEQRVTRQEETDEQTALREDDAEHHPEGHRPKTAQEGFRIGTKGIDDSRKRMHAVEAIVTGVEIGDVPVGVGPHPQPWPTDPRFDPELLAGGDRRNVVDEYRYWLLDAIVEDLDRRRHGFHVAIENFSHDFNIGSVVRTANAFMAAEVHIVGRRRWNRRGAMVTDRYQHVRHHADAEGLAAWCAEQRLTLIGIDNLPGSVPLESFDLPRECVLLFGQEGEGLSEPARASCSAVLSIAQFGSTRSINAGAAAAIAMHAWIRRHSFDQQP